MGGMIAVVILALLMVPVFFGSMQRVLAGTGSRRWGGQRAARVARASQAAIPMSAGRGAHHGIIHRIIRGD
jgi:hypothetical protein